MKNTESELSPTQLKEMEVSAGHLIQCCLVTRPSHTHTHTDPDRSVLQMQRGRMPCVEEEGKRALIMLLMLLLQKPIDYMYCLVTTIKREINKFISHLTTLHCMQSMYMHCIAGW